MVDLALASFAFYAGIFSLLNPCGVALLPAYISLLLAKNFPHSWAGRTLGALIAGVTLSAGFVAVFAVFGIVFSLLAGLKAYVPWISIATGGLLMLYAVLLHLGKAPKVSLGTTGGAREEQSLLTFGVGYALASLGCTLPLFLLAGVSAFSAGVQEALLVLGLYALGVVLFAVAIAFASALARDALSHTLARALPWIARANPLILFLAGAYITYTQLAILGLVP
jgi:cytochrome c biogenesis protein CcdA